MWNIYPLFYFIFCFGKDLCLLNQLFASKYIVFFFFVFFSFCFVPVSSLQDLDFLYIFDYIHFNIDLIFFIIILKVAWSFLEWTPMKFGSYELYLLFLWCISSLQLRFLSPTVVGWILDLLKWFSPWPLSHNTLLSRRFSCLYFPPNICFLIIVYFMIKQKFFLVTNS